MTFPLRSAAHVPAITAEEEAYGHILNGIRSGRFGPGDRLIEHRSASEAHKLLLKILARGDAVAAEQAMRDHVLGTMPLLSNSWVALIVTRIS